ncbi:MAG: radical SAM protein [Acholeplasmataceae bacterium]|nr:radical SAM protein [Acholeplasmataceae bacterium]
MNYLYGPVPSRRLGLSLGVSPIPKKTCNYACVYCQLGHTDHMTNTRQSFFDFHEIIKEFEEIKKSNVLYDVVSIVGEGEPTLYKDLKTLIVELKKRTDKPVTVITNGALLYNQEVKDALMKADIVLPSMDAYNEDTFKKINRPHGHLKFNEVVEGLISFSHAYQGELWLEIMLIKGMNDDEHSLKMFKEKLQYIKYNKLYLNTPIRPPAEVGIFPIDQKVMDHFSKELEGISIDLLSSIGFQSDIKDDITAIKSIIKRHPMNQYEILNFLKTRSCSNPQFILNKLKKDTDIEVVLYRNYQTYRLK